MIAAAQSTRWHGATAGWLLALAGIVAGGCSSEHAQRADEHTRRALIAAGDADSLATAALLTYKSGPAERLALASRAAAAAPERPDLAWLQLQECVRVSDCDVEPVGAQLRKLDPGNGAAWSGSLARSVSDPAKLRSTVVAIAASERFDMYWNSLIVHTANALMKSAGMPAQNAVRTAIGLTSAQALPAFQPLLAGCKGPVLEQPETLDQCRRLSAVLRHGDTYLAEMLGLSLAKSLWPVGSPGYQEVVEARRVALYRWETEQKVGSTFEGNDGSRRYLQLVAAHRREQEVVLAEIAQAGLEPNPSADWNDSDLGAQRP